jgi:hypothetical protein
VEREAIEQRWAMHGLTTLFRRARQIHRSEGLGALLRAGLRLLKTHLFEHRAYYLYGIALQDDADVRDAAPTPPLDNASHRIVSTNREAGALEAEGLEFRSLVPDARERLDSGAVATCIFVGHELAHIVWVAMSQEAKDSLKDPPFRLAFSEGECWSADAWTDPRYRRSGLLAYSDIKRRQFLLDKGVRTSLWAINKRNIPPQRFVARLSPQIRGEGRYLRVLWWKSWRERPLSQG